MSEQLWAPRCMVAGRTLDGRKVVGLRRDENDLTNPWDGEILNPGEASEHWTWNDHGRAYDKDGGLSQRSLCGPWVDDVQRHTVDVSKIRVGDSIRIGGEFVVTGIANWNPPCVISFKITQDMFASIVGDLVVEHSPAPRSVSVGSRVALDGGGEGEVIAVWEGCAWVRHKKGGELANDLPRTYPFDRLTRLSETA